METFRLMCNDAIRIGLAANASSLKRLSKLTYGELRRYDAPSCYKLCAISKGAGILAARKKSIRRGFPTKTPYLSKPMLVSCYRFKVQGGSLHIPIGNRCFERIPLNAHTLAVISESGLEVRSFTLSQRSLSLCIAKEVEEMKQAVGVLGVDRNLRNVTLGNAEQVVCYDVSKAGEIADNTRSTASARVTIKSIRVNADACPTAFREPCSRSCSFSPAEPALNISQATRFTMLQAGQASRFQSRPRGFWEAISIASNHAHPVLHCLPGCRDRTRASLASRPVPDEKSQISRIGRVRQTR